MPTSYAVDTHAGREHFLSRHNNNNNNDNDNDNDNDNNNDNDLQVIVFARYLLGMPKP